MGLKEAVTSQPGKNLETKCLFAALYLLLFFRPGVQQSFPEASSMSYDGTSAVISTYALLAARDAVLFREKAQAWRNAGVLVHGEAFRKLAEEDNLL